MLKTNAGKNNKINFAFLAFLTSFLLGLLIVLIGFALGKGDFYLGIDFNFQQVVFNSQVNNAIKSGNIFWSDTVDLGTNFIGAYSFYNLGSPFLWLSLLFPASLSYIVTPFMLTLKFGVAGLTSFCYIKQYVKQEKWALVASLLYAFSSYQLANINYNHFLDVTAFFPLLLLALDQAVTKRKFGYFAITVALLSTINYFFFISIVVFLIIYFIVKVICKEYLVTLSCFLSLAIESILGVLLSAVIFLPSVLFVFTNPRSTETIFSLGLAKMLFLKPHQYADLLHAFVLPSECIMNRGFILESNPTASEFYLPLFGIVLAASYFINNKKSWITKLSLTCFVFMLVPLLNSSFVGFNVEYYSRWFFMPLLIAALASGKQLESSENFKSGFLVCIGLFALLYGTRLLWKYYFKVEFFPNVLLAIVLFLLSLSALIVATFICKNINKSYSFPLIILSIFVFVLSNFTLNTYYMHKYWNKTFLPAKDFFNTQSLIYPEDDEYYRIDCKDVWINTGLNSSKPSINLFGSTISGSIFNFYIDSGYSRSVNSILPHEAYGFRTLLGVKYALSKSQHIDASPIYSDDIVFTDQEINFYENSQFLGMGFTYDHVISYDEYKKISKDTNHLAINKSMVLSPNQIDKYSDYFTELTAEDFTDFKYQDYLNTVDEKRNTPITNFSYDKNKYSFNIDANKDTLLFVSIPYDKGFSVTVNGKPVSYEKVNLSFIGVPIFKGENYVKISYTPPGFKLGLIVSILSAIALLSFTYLNKKGFNN